MHSRDVDIHGPSDDAPPTYITFDDPHLKAGTQLTGQYPSGVIDWGKGTWEIGTPFGKFGTFTLAFSEPTAKQAEFSFYAPRIFSGIDVYNDGSTDATISVRSPETREVVFTIKPGELRRLKTGWHDASSEIIFEMKNGQACTLTTLRTLTRDASELFQGVDLESERRKSH